MRLTVKLTPTDTADLVRKCLGTLPKQATLLLPAGDGAPALLDFAKLLSTQINLTCVAADKATQDGATKRSLRTVLVPPEMAKSVEERTRYAAWSAVKSVKTLGELPTVLLPDTLQDDAMSSLTTLDGKLAPVSHTAPGCEMLPRDAVTFARPLLSLGVADALPGVHSRAAVQHGHTRSACVEAVSAAAADILRDSVMTASHWGYVVVARRPLATAFANSELPTQAALTALMAHVSGTTCAPSPTSESVGRIARELLRPKGGSLPDIPKGRTAAGMVVRRATGRFARRIAEKARRRDVAPDDLLIFTREPDHEKSTLHTRRMHGNAACAPLNGAVYWDNRYVLLTRPVDTPSQVADIDVIEAALRPPPLPEEIIDAELYIRQLRRDDWERITAATQRVRDFGVPFECIRALPAVFQKSPGSDKLGVLTASPHLGVTSRNDLLFTAVRMPRLRTLPNSICPGFVLEQERQQREELDKAASAMRRSRRSKRAFSAGRT